MLFWISFTVFMICLIIESITSYIFIRRSKKKYPELWEHAGRPTLIGNGDLISAWPLNKYIKNREYLEISDVKAKEFAETIRAPHIYSYYSAGISVVIFLLVAAIFGAP